MHSAHVLACTIDAFSHIVFGSAISASVDIVATNNEALQALARRGTNLVDVTIPDLDSLRVAHLACQLATTETAGPLGCRSWDDRGKTTRCCVWGEPWKPTSQGGAPRRMLIFCAEQQSARAQAHGLTGLDVEY